MNNLSTSFTKYHGNGNDFIIFDLVDENHAVLQKIITEKTRALCDRHQGIGGDGVIMMHKQNGQWCMTVINADGSPAQNCGNGLRIAALHLSLYHQVRSINIGFAGASYACAMVDGEVLVAMGQCTIRRADDLLSLPSSVSFAQGHIGNDHLIFFMDDGEHKYAQLLAYVQDKLPNAGDFNLGFLWSDKEGNFISRVFERGVGFTKSCGTGAIVAASFLVARGLTAKNPVVINQPGGKITVSATVANAYLDTVSLDIVQQGVAVQVFRGICQLANY